MNNPKTIQSGDYSDTTALLQALMELPPTPYIPMKAEQFNPKEG